MKRFFTIVALLSIYGCSTISTPIASMVDDDAKSFVMLAQKYGSEADKLCAKGILDTWQKIVTIDNEPTPIPAFLADSYKSILLSRLVQVAKAQGTQDCGHLALEVIIMAGKKANKFRP